MTAPSKLLVAFAAAALAVCVTGAASAERSTSSSGQKPPAETPVQIMPAGIYPLTPEREQALRPKDSFKECDACPEMVVVPKGSFIMGTPITEVDRSKGEDPLHRVTFARPFAVGRFTISFDEWDACLADGGCGGNKGDDKFGRGRMPAQGINFEAAKSYLAWLSRKVGRTYRLPSESEREYFTRAGTTTPFWFGNTISAQNANYVASTPQCRRPARRRQQGPGGGGFLRAEPVRTVPGARQCLGMDRRLLQQALHRGHADRRRAVARGRLHQAHGARRHLELVRGQFAFRLSQRLLVRHRQQFSRGQDAERAIIARYLNGSSRRTPGPICRAVALGHAVEILHDNIDARDYGSPFAGTTK
jgi:formylglycine-generating enzyme required for sulfatase activity